MVLIYKIFECGCIYSACISGTKACDPTLSYCCLSCHQDLSIDGYKENLDALQTELDAFDIVELFHDFWVPSSFIKEYIRNHIGKDEIENMWENAQDIRIQYQTYMGEV